MQPTNRIRAANRPTFRRAVLSLLTLLILTGLMVYIFKDNLPEMRTALARLSLPQIAALLGLGLTFPLLEAVICQKMVSTRLPGYSYRRALDVTFLGTFGNVVALGAGTIPMQSYDLYLSGLPVGPGVGMTMLQYVFHKSAVLLYAGVLLLCNGRWLLAADTAGLMRYLLPACLMVAAIILALVLVCTSRTVQGLLYRLLALLPKTEKWQARRQSWSGQLEALCTEGRRLLADKPLCVKIFGLQVFKLALMYIIAWLAVGFMGLGSLTFWHAQTLAALMMLLSNALPNLGGMGSIETSFYLVFTGFLGQGGAMSALVAYRAATYYFPFAVSCLFFFMIQRRWSASAARPAAQ